VVVSKGDDFTLTSRSVVGKQKISCVTYDLWQRKSLWINNSPDDGRVEMRVEQVDRVAKELRCRITVGGTLSNNKGVNFPGVYLSIKQ